MNELPDIWDISYYEWVQLANWKSFYTYKTKQELMELYPNYLDIKNAFGLIYVKKDSNVELNKIYTLEYKYGKQYRIYYHLDKEVFHPYFPNAGRSIMILNIQTYNTDLKSIIRFSSIGAEFWRDFNPEINNNLIYNKLESIIDLLPIMDYNDIKEIL